MPDADKDTKKRTAGDTCEFDRNSPDEWDFYVCSDVAARGENKSTSWLVSFTPPRPELAVSISDFGVLIEGDASFDFAFNQVEFQYGALDGRGWSYIFMVVDVLNRSDPPVPTVRCRFAYHKVKTE